MLFVLLFYHSFHIYAPLQKAERKVTVHLLSPRGVFTLFLRDKPETDMREIAVLRFLCIGCRERSEQQHLHKMWNNMHLSRNINNFLGYN